MSRGIFHIGSNNSCDCLIDITRQCICCMGIKGNIMVRKRLLKENDKDQEIELLKERLQRTEAELRQTRGEIEQKVAERTDRLRAAYCRLQHAAETIDAAFMSLDRQWRFTYLNKRALDLSPYGLEEHLNHTIWELYPQMIGSEMERQYRKAMDEGVPVRFETQDPKFHGAWMEIIASPTEDGLTLLGYDVTERKRTEEALRESERRYRQLIEVAPMLIAVHANGRLVYTNPATRALYGITDPEYYRDRPVLEFIHPDDRKKVYQRIMQLYRNEPVPTTEEKYIRPDGTSFTVEVSSTPVVFEGLRAILTVGYDVTLRKQAEETVRASLTQKETLLKEIHHRIKNNLHTVNALLGLQAFNLTPEKVTQALKESQNRIKSIALVHEKLYRSMDVGRLNFAEYLRSLSEDLLRGFGMRDGRVELEVDAEDIYLDIDTAMPCGLVLNELITNSLRHGFPGNRSGTIRVSLKQVDDNVMLSVEDDGVGLPEGFDVSQSASLGLKLVNSLAGQLEGSLEFEPCSGACVRLYFPLKKEAMAGV